MTVTTCWWEVWDSVDGSGVERSADRKVSGVGEIHLLGNLGAVSTFV